MPRRLRFTAGLQKLIASVPPAAVLVDIHPGRGEYGQAMLDQLPEAKLTSIRKPPADALVPYRSVHGIWIADRLTALSPAQALGELNLLWGWLLPGGTAYLCVLEGEGYKLRKEQGADGATLQTYYQPPELEALIIQAGFNTLDAWREAINERPFIHLLIQRPQ